MREDSAACLQKFLKVLSARNLAKTSLQPHRPPFLLLRRMKRRFRRRGRARVRGVGCRIARGDQAVARALGPRAVDLEGHPRAGELKEPQRSEVRETEAGGSEVKRGG